MKRQVHFADPVSKVVKQPTEEENQGMRMKDARDAVPRKEGESRQQWKNRIFNYKRQEEAKKEGAGPFFHPFHSKVLALGGEVPVMAGRSADPVEAGYPGKTGKCVEEASSYAAGSVVPSVSREEANAVSRGFAIEPKCLEEVRLQQDEGDLVDGTTCQLLDCCHVNVLLKCGFESLCHRAATFEPSPTQLGIVLLQLLLVSPRDGAKIRLWIETQCSGTSTSPIRVRDLLPLPPYPQQVLL